MVRKIKLDTIVKIMDLEEEVNKDIDALVDLKMDITHLIKLVDNHEYQIILEQRYLSFKTWEQISVIWATVFSTPSVCMIRP